MRERGSSEDRAAEDGAWAAVSGLLAEQHGHPPRARCSAAPRPAEGARQSHARGVPGKSLPEEAPRVRLCARQQGPGPDVWAHCSRPGQPGRACKPVAPPFLTVSGGRALRHLLGVRIRLVGTC